MPNSLTRKTKGINLIRKEVQIRKHVRYEKDWYILMNILIISVVSALSIISFLFKVNMKYRIDTRTAALADKINNNLNTNSRTVIRSRINSLEDKYNIYKDFQTQNFDVNQFYNEVLQIYPGIKITKFIVQPDSPTIDLNILIEQDGYNKLPELLQAIERNPRFENSIIKSVNFALKDDVINSKSAKTLADDVKKSGNFKTEISVIVEKLSPVIAEGASN
jgi:hypothetical protein